jgi:hypothetical protein
VADIAPRATPPRLTDSEWWDVLVVLDVTGESAVVHRGEAFATDLAPAVVAGNTVESSPVPAPPDPASTTSGGAAAGTATAPTAPTAPATEDSSAAQAQGLVEVRTAVCSRKKVILNFSRKCA